jgi:hypothetical protein
VTYTTNTTTAARTPVWNTSAWSLPGEYCCSNDYDLLINNDFSNQVRNIVNTAILEKSKNERKESDMMNFDFSNMFSGMFKPVGRGMCKIGMNGKVAIKTSSGYKTFDIDKKKLVNCDSFAFDMEGAFWVVPTFKVEKGDIILVNGKPRIVIEVNDGSIKTFSYEDSTIDEIIPEHHVFLGKTYCYGKIFSPFMNMTKDNGEGMSSLMNMVMMSQMFGGNTGLENGMNPFMMMMFMNGKDNPFANLFEGAFNFGVDEESEG